MKLFTTKQIAGIDKFTIENEPVADIDLMERAAMQITNWLVQHFSTEEKLIFFAGPGNNAGDALAIARQMAAFEFQCEVFLLDLGKGLKNSPAINWKRLEEQGKVKLSKITCSGQFPQTHSTDVFLDGLFGSGLSRPLEGLPAEIVHQMNERPNTVVSVDIPSGLMGEDNSRNIPENIVRADFTLTFQFPKMSFLFPENEEFTGKWEVLPIGLLPEGIAKTSSDFFLVEKEDVKEILPRRSKFAHKGHFGHALLIAGSYGKMGAAVLASKGCLRSGTGLLTTHVPRLGYTIIQVTVPEAMTSIDPHDSLFTEFPELAPFSAIAIGPGIGLKHNSRRALHELIDKAEVPMVLDADALNILSEDKHWLTKLPENSILTPHPGEFRRLAGETADSYERMQIQREFAKEYHVIVVLKGAFTTVATPGGKVYFNASGNPGMATAGSGDALTGIMLGLLAQRFPAYQAAIAGVFLHGLAGDLAAGEKSENALIAGDIVEYLGNSFMEMV
jgi:ADP-dependent NAD(P)H-hydrate dehydratase / NAD(P)H-hydrate epimerase